MTEGRKPLVTLLEPVVVLLSAAGLLFGPFLTFASFYLLDGDPGISPGLALTFLALFPAPVWFGAALILVRRYGKQDRLKDYYWACACLAAPFALLMAGSALR